MTLQSEAEPEVAPPPPRGALMRAVLLDRVGDAPVLRVGEVARPVPVLDEVLVHVIAASVGPLDVRTAAGGGAVAGVGAWPAVLGHAFSGVVVRSPSDTFRLRPGDEVYGVSAAPRASGAFAEFVAVPSTRLALKPRVLSHAEAAGLPLSGLIAWGAVVEVAKAHEGQRMLIHAGSGGVGPLTARLASYFGARVTVTAPSAQAACLHDLGEPEVVDRDAVRFEDVVDGADVVVDLTDEGLGARSVGLLQPAGLLVRAGTDDDPEAAEAAERAGVRTTRLAVVPDCATLAVLDRLITSGDLLAPEATVLPIESVAEAHRLVASGAVCGEVVLQVTDY